jgi:hypothetical protein
MLAAVDGEDNVFAAVQWMMRVIEAEQLSLRLEKVLGEISDAAAVVQVAAVEWAIVAVAVAVAVAVDAVVAGVELLKLGRGE